MSPISASARARLATLQIGTCSKPPEADFASAPANSGEWRSVVTSASTAKAAAGAQNRADVMRIGDLVEDQHEAVRRQVRDVDRRERPRLEQQSLMDRLARSAGGDLLETHDPGFEPARGDFGAEPLGRGRRRVEADQLAARRLERRSDAVKAIDPRNLGLPPLRPDVPVAAIARAAAAPTRRAAASSRRRRVSGISAGRPKACWICGRDCGSSARTSHGLRRRFPAVSSFSAREKGQRHRAPGFRVYFECYSQVEMSPLSKVELSPFAEAEGGGFEWGRFGDERGGAGAA